MRNFDNWDVYTDNDGNLLHGKVRFCRKGTTDDITIMNSDGAPIRNPSFTDILGRTEYQVFVGSSDDVSAYFYKYIGSGQMESLPAEDYDPSRWSPQYEVTSVNPVSALEISGDGAPGVPDIGSLRALVPANVPEVDGNKLMWVYGYYAAGDTSPVLYMWDGTSQETDDGGAVIKANSIPGPGRWLLVTRELHFDVRHFGIFPTTDAYSNDASFTSQIANCAAYIDKVGCDAWFPSLKGERSFYLFDGANTFSIKGDIFVSDDARFQCKTGTAGTSIACHELHKETKFLFDASVHTGTGTLTADRICVSWTPDTITGNARLGWIIDDATYGRTITGKEVYFETNGSPYLTLAACEITSDHKITGQISLIGCTIKTSFFADDYDWSRLTALGNRIILQNCKDADTYVLLKNKQGESNYGDLGEQTVHGATLLPGALAENASFEGVAIQGSTELHNVSGTVSTTGSDLELNAIDSWLSFTSPCSARTVAMRGGCLSGSPVQVSDSLLLDGTETLVQIGCTGASARVVRCKVMGAVYATAIELLDNDIHATIDQVDQAGTISVKCIGNRFHDGARHYVHAVTPGSRVVGTWSGNGSTYDNVHWIRLDRTNLLDSDTAHAYTYAGNSEPYLSKWNGRNRPMTFKKYAGHWSSSQQGTGIFSTTTIPFIFYNTRSRAVSVVPRGNYWKMFTVGRAMLARTGRIMSEPLTIGISEGDYSEHDNGQVPVVWTWGCQWLNYDGGAGYAQCVCRDGTGEADYVCSFESADASHGTYSYGQVIGYYPSNDWDSGSDTTAYAVYPNEPNECRLFVLVDPDFSTVNNP